MDHLVFLDAEAGELEKILGGLKSVIATGNDSSLSIEVNPGDSLFFLRNNGERTVRVKATVVRAWSFHAGSGEDLAHHLKALQSRLQLTEGQYNHWSTGERILFVEFENAQKIQAFDIAPDRLMDRKQWISFEDIQHLTNKSRYAQYPKEARK